MTRQQWENELLMEFEGLDYFARILKATDELLEQGLDEYGSELDPNLVVCLECLRYDLNLTLSGKVRFGKKLLVDGVLKQLENCADEVQTLQAGLPTKGGIKDEDLQEDDE
jgi:hypothetical protein